MPRLPTDRTLLGEIYSRHYQEFVAYSDENKNRSTKIFVPININDIAKEFDTDPDMIFGRLYYHLNKIHGAEDKDGNRSDFFAIRVGGDTHCVNFPFLSSILADLEDQHRQFVVATGLAGFSLVVSFISVLIAILT